MGDEGQLSQDEIDALLSGSSDFDLDKTGDSSADESDSSSAEDDLLDLLGGGPPSAEEETSTQGKTKETKKKDSKPKVIDTNQKYEYNESGNMGLLLDVMMNLTIELGRTTKEIKEVLNYGEGSVVELDKLYGEPVDIMINGRLFARGEVVIIDETYGVRVSEIINPDDRYKMLR